MASFLSLFKKKNKSEDKVEDEIKEPEQKERKLKKQLSISRSGRYKQKKQRGAIAERTDLFQPDRPETNDQNVDATGASSGHSRSPNNSCREINGVIMPGGIRRNEQIAS